MLFRRLRVSEIATKRHSMLHEIKHFRKFIKRAGFVLFSIIRDVRHSLIELIRLFRYVSAPIAGYFFLNAYSKRWSPKDGSTVLPTYFQSSVFLLGLSYLFDVYNKVFMRPGLFLEMITQHLSYIAFPFFNLIMGYPSFGPRSTHGNFRLRMPRLFG